MHCVGRDVGCIDAKATMQVELTQALCLCLQDKFFAQLKSSPNGFSVIADFFGRGLLDAASISTARCTL